MERVEAQAPKPPNKSNWISSYLLPSLRAAIVPVVAVIVALIIGAIIIALSGSNPLVAYKELLIGAVGSPRAIQRTLERATPLIFGGLALTLAFKAGLFNIGAQGQLILGAILAGWIGYIFTDLPAIVHIPLALAIGALVGALYGAIPGFLKAYSGAHEVIVTIMLNYIAGNLTDYLSNGPWKDRARGNVVARTPKIAESAEIPSLGDILPFDISILNNIPLGAVLAGLVAIFVWWLINKSTLGFEMRTVGENPHAAQYAGISVKRITIIAMLLSGLLAGLGGAVETLGVNGRFEPGTNAGLGFNAITIALLARVHPIGVIPAALLIGMMQAGGALMQFNAKVAIEIIDIVQALILFFVAADILIRKMLRMRKSEGGLNLSGGWGGS